MKHFENIVQVDKAASLKPGKKGYPLSVVKLTIAMAVVMLCIIALSLSDAETKSAASPPFAISVMGTALMVPSWRRRCKRRCWVKIIVAFAVIGSCLLLVNFVPGVRSNCTALLCMASALLGLIAITPFLANRR